MRVSFQVIAIAIDIERLCELAWGGTQKHKGKVGCLLKAELVSQKVVSY